MTMDQSSFAASAPRRAGGRATEAGMAFQAAVATWFAVHILVRMPVGGCFGINNRALPATIRLETGEGLDDIEVAQSDGGVLQIQCKTKATLGTGSGAPLTKTVSQLVTWVAEAKAGDGLPDLTRNVAMLAVRFDSPRTLDDLESGCRAFDLGGEWADTCSQRTQAERGALSALEKIATSAWSEQCGRSPDGVDLADLARLFRISRFSMDEGANDWREASRLLGRHLFGDEAAGDAPLRDLVGIMRDLIGSGAPADRSGLLRSLRRLGHNDVGSPCFETDLAALQAVTDRELERLAVHGLLPLCEGIPITRQSDGPLLAAMRSGSLLVVGDPGAGKTGALVRAAAALVDAGETVVFLSVDRFPGVAIAADLVSELGLTHPLVDTLAAMPGAGRKILIIDALDAARGGSSEAVFAALIENVRERLADEWIVVASIRTFDLKNGCRFRSAFAGTPAEDDYVEPGLTAVRHFLVPRLSDADLAMAGAASPELGILLDLAPPHLVELLRNIFNLSLASQLLADGTEPAAFSAMRTQSGLVDAYEDARLDTTALQVAAGATAAAMVDRRRYAVRKVVVGDAALDEVIQTGVLAESGDLVSFAHHVLFDHVAGRFYLECDDPDNLLSQLAGDTTIALLLTPALRFAVERLWRFDCAGRERSWKLVTGIFSEGSVDPVLGNAALRVVVENIEDEGDLAGLTARVADSPSDPALARLFGGLARFAAMDIETRHPMGSSCAIAWARFAEVLVATGELMSLDAARVLLRALFGHEVLADVKVLDVSGRAARALLESAWAASPRVAPISYEAIRFVGKSFSSDPSASRALLDRILREPHFSQYADQEATWLAEQILPITRVDPEFTVEIYVALYGQTIADETTSWLGGQPSRIMPLSSNRRQDYEHCRWRLGRAMGEVLAISPEHGTRALIDALIGVFMTRGYGGDHEPDYIDLGTTRIELRGSPIEFNAWDEEEEDGGVRDDDLLREYVRFLRNCDAAAFKASVAAASREYATAAVWARIFGVGSERVAEVSDLLWPLIERPDFLENSVTLRDAIRFVAAGWPLQTREARIRFETMARDETRFTDEDDLRRWQRILGRILALVPEDALELETMRELRGALEAESLLSRNEPIYGFTSTWGDRGDFEREQLRRSGVDMDAGRNQEVLDASDALHAHVERCSSAPDLAGLWEKAEDLLALIEANPGLHDQLDRSAWGHVANAVERVASSSNYVPGAHSLPDLATMFSVLEHLSSSCYPEFSEPLGSISWGNWDVRVYGAKAWVSLAPRFALEHPEIVDHLEAVLDDPVPAVRLQAARNLQVICEAASERMWSMGERIATRETEPEIVAFYLSNSMLYFSHAEPERCEAVLTIVKERLGGFATDDEQRNLLQEALGVWTARLFVAQGRVLPRTWLEEWVADPDRYGNLLDSFTSALRGALFNRYRLDAETEECVICDRAQEGLALILTRAIGISVEAFGVLTSEADETQKSAARQRYRSAEKAVHHAMNQLYFGSGQHSSNSGGEPGLTDAASMARFLDDYADILALFASTREPATLHELIELYEFLIPGDPVTVFETIHAILLGRGEETGYQHESLGRNAVVRIVQRYLADHRAIFEDANRRAQLVAILRLFSEVGWPDALKLLYDLPDLLR